MDENGIDARAGWTALASPSAIAPTAGNLVRRLERLGVRCAARAEGWVTLIS